MTRKKRLLRYLNRPCMGADWRCAFPDVPKDDIRKFLNIFIDAFIFKSKDRLKFGPKDKLMDVYKTIYAPGSMCDAMEVETFAVSLEREYGVDLSKTENLEEISFSDIFKMTRISQQKDR